MSLDLLHAQFSHHSYPLHSHDYYVIALVETGLQYFRLGKQKYLTQPGGLIFLNPGESHTGEPEGGGYRYRAMYPQVEHMQAIAQEMGMQTELPLFPSPRRNNALLAKSFAHMHALLMKQENNLAAETAFIGTMAKILRAFGDAKSPVAKTATIRRALAFIHENYAQPISLNELAALESLSRYHFLRSFGNQVGMPPHMYIENYRIAAAQRLLATGLPLAQVAVQVGFNSQSHFTRRFRQTLGVTPGRYARLLQA
ncbi:MAG: AraC family transcriptional regulator [Anaerolineales bacterium]|nr:AraC family transcriptional regulator [Anaerolineales bacterium]